MPGVAPVRGNGLDHAMPAPCLHAVTVAKHLVETRAAQVDLLGRHLRPWAVATRSRLATRTPGAFYEAVVSLAGAAFAADTAYLETAFVSTPA